MAEGPLDTGTDELLARFEEGVVVLTLNRPERRNALYALPFPTLAALPGPAAGAGLSIALA